MKYETLKVQEFKHIVVLTGAGISAASGLRTYRGKDGIWEEGDVERLSHTEALRTAPDEARQFYSELRKAVIKAKPNAAHISLAHLEASLEPDQEFTLITQNVDGLHFRAGSKNVTEMHGAIYRSRCSNEQCGVKPYEDSESFDLAPFCKNCDTILRPDIVLFGEMIPASSDWIIRRALRKCDLFVAIGTSGTVYPACDFVRSAKYAGAKTLLINPEPIPSQQVFDQHICANAEDVLPALFGMPPDN